MINVSLEHTVKEPHTNYQFLIFPLLPPLILVVQKSTIGWSPFLKPTRHDIPCVHAYIYASARVSTGKIAGRWSYWRQNVEWSQLWHHAQERLHSAAAADMHTSLSFHSSPLLWLTDHGKNAQGPAQIPGENHSQKTSKNLKGYAKPSLVINADLHPLSSNQAHPTCLCCPWSITKNWVLSRPSEKATQSTERPHNSGAHFKQSFTNHKKNERERSMCFAGFTRANLQP